MRYSLISDMHVNHPQPKTQYDLLEKIVVVAGDTDNGLGGLKFLQKLRNKGHTVIAVDGNHEHYSNVSGGRTRRETAERFRKDFPSEVEIEGVTFLSTNGWYVVRDPYAWFGYMNDGRYCVGDNPEEAAYTINGAAHDSFLFLREGLLRAKDGGYKTVVTTHTAPCTDTLDPSYEGSPSNSWYYNPMMLGLMEEFREEILVWNHGHTHAPADKIVQGVRVVCNPRGYPGENPDWKPKTVEAT